jgi:hypothetical protein
VRRKPLLFRRSVDRSDADLVLMMDVIEHVEDDVGLVRGYVDKVAWGTRFIVTVPAMMWLWSGHDVFLEHYRRYTLTSIEKVLRAGGLAVKHGCYFYGFLMPLAAALRGVERLRSRGHPKARSQMHDVGTALNLMLWSVCRAELPVFRMNRS